MGGGTTTRAAGLAAGAPGVSAGAGSAHGALPAAGGVVGGSARHGRPPLLVSVSASSPSGAALLTERGGGRRHPPHPCFCDEDGLESAGEEEAEGSAGCVFVEGYVFGPVPSREEVVVAVSAIQQVFFPLTFPQDAEDQFSSTAGKDTKDETLITDARHRVSSTGSRSDCFEPARELNGSNYIQHQARDKVLDACHSLQINPTIQVAPNVLSTVSDKAVWDAVMENEAVKELRKSICRAQNVNSPSSDDGYDVLERLLKWIIEFSKEKVTELVNKIVKIVKELLVFHEKDKVGQIDPFEDALRSSFMLTIMVFIVVVITRYHKTLQ